MKAIELKTISLEDLRNQWTTAWGRKPHKRIGRKMLERSLAFKQSEQKLTSKQQSRLNQLIKQYKRNPRCFDQEAHVLKPGTRLVRMHNGKKHSVLVKTDGFEYEGKSYRSLSKIANNITGSRWNGHVFFGLKKVGAS